MDTRYRSMQYGLLQRWAANDGKWWEPPEGLCIRFYPWIGTCRARTDRGLLVATVTETEGPAQFAGQQDYPGGADM